jgi:phosphoserine phosphatase RsbU/P
MPTILLIEDDPTSQLLLQEALEKSGYHVVLADNGQTGWESAQTLKPEVILCDWSMPVLDGLELCRRVKQDPNLSASFFIFLTARYSIEDCVKGLDSGADDFISKPVELPILQARLRAGLRLHQMHQDLHKQKQMLEEEFTEAAEYVRSLLPDPISGQVNLDSRFIPSFQLGGDCFDYHWLDPDYLAIYLFDVSGHGLGAALLSISVLNLLRSQSMDGVNFYQPSHVLQALNETFQMNSQNEKYFTIWYGVYNRVKRQLIYSCAGHPPALLLSQQDGKIEVTKLKTPGLPIGMIPDTRYRNQRIELIPKSALYVFSDGVYEILQENGEMWSFEGFMAHLVANEHRVQTAGLDTILEHLQDLNAQTVFEDDISLLRMSLA